MSASVSDFTLSFRSAVCTSVDLSQVYNVIEREKKIELSVSVEVKIDPSFSGELEIERWTPIEINVEPWNPTFRN